MKKNLPVIEVKEDNISRVHWESLAAKYDKRKKQPAIPDNISRYISKLQSETISNMQGYGWEILFIRRSDPQNIVTVMHCAETHETALIEHDGYFNHDHNVLLRQAS